MIIGNGLIANLFIQHDLEDTVFFASGVSNSSETQKSCFEREEKLLLNTLKTHPQKKLIYFSTCSIYDPSKKESPYVHHKQKMETLVAKHASCYLILRASNAVGNGGNPNLLMNYLVHSVQNELKIIIHLKATRNLISVDDIRSLTLRLLKEGYCNTIINLAYPEQFFILEIVNTLEIFFEKKANLIYQEKGSDYQVPIPEIASFFLEKNWPNKNAYLEGMLEKYYSDFKPCQPNFFLKM